MRKKVVFTTEAEKALVLQDNAGLRLIEETYNGDENSFLFTDEPGIEGAQEKSLEKRVVELEARVSVLENSVV